jgi:glutaconate CoA-transferase subunit A
MAAEQAFVSCERIVPTAELTADSHPATLRINRLLVTGVIEAPNGAHFTSCVPDYGRDEEYQREYARAAADPQAWREFSERYLSGSEEEYQAAVAARRQEVPA